MRCQRFDDLPKIRLTERTVTAQQVDEIGLYDGLYQRTELFGTQGEIDNGILSRSNGTKEENKDTAHLENGMKRNAGMRRGLYWNKSGQLG